MCCIHASARTYTCRTATLCMRAQLPSAGRLSDYHAAEQPKWGNEWQGTLGENPSLHLLRSMPRFAGADGGGHNGGGRRGKEGGAAERSGDGRQGKAVQIRAELTKRYNHGEAEGGQVPCVRYTLVSRSSL